MTITVDQACVTVAAPLRTSKRVIREWVAHKQVWVRKKLLEQSTRLAEVPKRSYCEGELWPYLGKQLTLHLAVGPRAVCYGDDQSITLVLARRSKKPREAQAAELMSRWYRERAQSVLEQKTECYAKALDVTVTEVKLRLTKSKWGHCTPEGVLQYNWLVMQAPEQVVDYLVAHEVSHRVHLNHSAAFWHTVEQICPDYSVQRHWLRTHGHKLVF